MSLRIFQKNKLNDDSKAWVEIKQSLDELDSYDEDYFFEN